MNDYVKFFNKGDIMRIYNNLSPSVRKKAWESLQNWILNPGWDGMRNPLLRKKMFSDLTKSKYFFPASDKNLVDKIFHSLKNRNKDEYFMMIRLSQNERPLTWVLGQGGTGVTTRVRIGVDFAPGWGSAVVYTVVMGKAKQIIYQSTSLQVIMKSLRDYYVKPKRTYAWPLLSKLTTIQSL